MVDRPVPVAIAVEPPPPPAELTRCARRPAGLPEDPALAAQIPDAVRSGIIRVATALGSNSDQLDRLINWIAPASCPAPAKEVDGG